MKREFGALRRPEGNSDLNSELFGMSEEWEWETISGNESLYWLPICSQSLATHNLGPTNFPIPQASRPAIHQRDKYIKPTFTIHLRGPIWYQSRQTCSPLLLLLCEFLQLLVLQMVRNPLFREPEYLAFITSSSRIAMYAISECNNLLEPEINYYAHNTDRPLAPEGTRNCYSHP